MPRPRHSSLTMASRSMAERQRLLDERVVERRPLAVHRQDVEPGVERARHPRGGVGVHALLLIGRELGDDVDLALEQRGDARRRLGDGADDPAVDVDLAAPVVGVGVEHGLVVLHPRHEAHGPGADGLGVEGVVAHRLQVLLRHDLAAVERQPRGQERVGLLGVDDERDGSGASIRSMVVKTVATMVLASGSYVRSMLNLASAEVNGSPLWNLTPWRSLNVHVVWPLELPLGGQAGVELAVRVPARQVVEEVERDADVVRRRAEVRVELGDVAALGGDQLLLLGGLGLRRAGSAWGSAPATPRAAAPLSNSRRVTCMGCTSIRFGSGTA